MLLCVHLLCTCVHTPVPGYFFTFLEFLPVPDTTTVTGTTILNCSHSSSHVDL